MACRENVELSAFRHRCQILSTLCNFVDIGKKVSCCHGWHKTQAKSDRIKTTNTLSVVYAMHYWTNDIGSFFLLLIILFLLKPSFYLVPLFLLSFSYYHHFSPLKRNLSLQPIVPYFLHYFLIWFRNTSKETITECQLRFSSIAQSLLSASLVAGLAWRIFLFNHAHASLRLYTPLCRFVGPLVNNTFTFSTFSGQISLHCSCPFAAQSLVTNCAMYPALFFSFLTVTFCCRRAFLHTLFFVYLERIL